MPLYFYPLTGFVLASMANIRYLLGILILSSFLVLPSGSARAEPVTIVALGDSLVHGYGLLPDQGFVARMQDWLNAQGLDAILVNAGVSGDTTAGGRSRIDWTLAGKVDGMIISLGGNDALRGIDPAETRANLKAILQATAEKGVPVLLIGISAPGNFGREYQKNFNKIYQDLAVEFDSLFYPNFLGALMEMPDQSAVLQDYFQADGLHPNADGVNLIVEDMGPSVANLVRAASR